MATQRQVEEVVARYVASAVFYVSSGETPGAKEVIAADAAAVAKAVSRWGLSREAIEQAVLRPLEGELTARYGDGPGRSLTREFTGAFRVISRLDPLPPLVKT